MKYQILLRAFRPYKLSYINIICIIKTGYQVRLQIIEISALLFLLIINQSCGVGQEKEFSIKSEPNEVDIFNKYSSDSIRSEIFKIAFKNKSTAPNYIVFKAKDLNTNIVKEICCEAPFLSGAMHRELQVNYDKEGIVLIDSLILEKRTQIFEFKNQDALNNINFFDYPDYQYILNVAKRMDLDYYQSKFGNNDSTNSMYFENDSGFVQLTFAHIMYMCGILTRRDCEAGNNIWIGNPNK
jgi:hypothetical protein